MKNKILSLIITVCILVLPLTVISFASAEDTAIINSAFFVDPAEKSDIYAYVEDEEVTYEISKSIEELDEDSEEYPFQYVYISVFENTAAIDDVENYQTELKEIFDYVIEGYLYLFDEVQFKSKISEINGYKCVNFYGVDDDTYYYNAYLLATEEKVYCFLTETDDKNAPFITNATKSFTVNGTLLNGDSHNNLVDFTGAEDYKEQAASFGLFGSEDFNFLDEETNKYARIGVIMFMIPFFILFVITVIVIVKYSKNKKVLEEYESKYGIMGMGMPPYMNNMNYGAPMNNSYMPQQPIQQPTQPINQNYQAPTDNDGQNNNF